MNTMKMWVIKIENKIVTLVKFFNSWFDQVSIGRRYMYFTDLYIAFWIKLIAWYCSCFIVCTYNRAKCIPNIILLEQRGIYMNKTIGKIKKTNLNLLFKFYCYYLKWTV